MKIRTGYVSNSSSSSFVIIGEKLNKKSALESIINNDDVYIIINNAGHSGEVEDYVSKLTRETYNFFLNSGKLTEENYHLWKADKIIDAYSDEKNIDLTDFDILPTLKRVGFLQSTILRRFPGD